jgi:transglutaminase-like putative cysteine protease
MRQFLEPNEFVDSEHPAVVAYAMEHGQGNTPREIAISLYYAVRDGFRYSPWNVSMTPADFRASTVVQRPYKAGAHCIDKAILLVALGRVHQIPTRIHFADVRNHLGTANLEEQLGTDLLVYHGYCEWHLDGKWVASTPAFNAQLCVRLGVAPLEFDGIHDSVFQAYDRSQGKFMEYVEDHGSHAGIPFDDMMAAWEKHYGLTSHGWPKP